MAPGRKTGGRVRGVSNNKPKIKLDDTDENRELVAMAQLMRTPKAVILDAMMHFETLGRGFLAKADKMMKTRAEAEKIAAAADAGHRYIIAAVKCAAEVAPYIHAKLSPIESRGDMTQDKAPYVVRVPAVLADSTAWQAAVGAALGEAVASTAPSGAQPVAFADPRPSPPPVPDPALVAKPVPLGADLKTGRISTITPAGHATARPTGTQEWLDAVAASQRKAG